MLRRAADDRQGDAGEGRGGDELSSSPGGGLLPLGDLDKLLQDLEGMHEQGGDLGGQRGSLYGISKKKRAQRMRRGPDAMVRDRDVLYCLCANKRRVEYVNPYPLNRTDVPDMHVFTSRKYSCIVSR